MTEHFSLLARGEDDAIKIVIGVVVAIVWGIGALISAVNKKVQEQKRREQYNRLPRGLPTMPSGVVVSNIPSPPPIPRQQRGKRRKQSRPMEMVPADQVIETAPVQVEDLAQSDSPAARAKAAQDAAPEASRVARLLRRPDTLRAAFILNEVLGPPKAMRSE